MLDAIGEGRIGMGEGRRVVWGSSKEGGDEFAVAFDRDVVVFGMDSRPRCRVMAAEKTKVHEIGYVSVGEGEEEGLLAVSTEDGRVLFFDTRTEVLAAEEEKKDGKAAVLPNAKLVAQLGGKEAGVDGRIKDFKFLAVDGEDGERLWYVITGSSDGKLRVWKLEAKELKVTGDKAEEKKQVGTLLGTYATQNRITCVEAFVMIPRPEGVVDSEDEAEEEEELEEEARDGESGDDSD
jgi:protein MAK11